MPSDSVFKTNFNWQQQQYQKVERVLRDNAAYMLRIRLSSFEEDTKECTDMVIEVDGGKIAVRLRRWASHKDLYRELTLRSYKDGHITELEKLRTGRSDVRWYFYGWMDQQDNLTEWLLVDVPVLLQTGVLSKPRREIFNKDGGKTRFIAVPQNELRDCKALLRARMKDRKSGYWYEMTLDNAGGYTTVATMPGQKAA